MQAAEHLAAAGLEEEADEIRRCAESLRGTLLQEKLAELARLQAEIRQLQGSAAHQQVKIHVEIVELSLTKMRELGFEYRIFDPNKTALYKTAVAKAADKRTSPCKFASGTGSRNCSRRFGARTSSRCWLRPL